MSHNDRQFKFRIPPELSDALEQSARENNRTLTAEILARLETATLSTPASRLKSILSQINQTRYGRPLLPSTVAELIGESSATTVEAVMAGRETPSFDLLNRIAALLGASPEWLKHGTANQFPIIEERYFGLESAKKLVALKPRSIAFIRCRNDAGNLAIVAQLDELRYSCFSTGLHVSKHIGAGGEAQLMQFSNACCWLSRQHSALAHGYMLDDPTFREMARGSLYPGLALKAAKISGWFDDWWDPSMFKAYQIEGYWEGYRSLCYQIFDAVEEDQRLSEERSRIMQHLV